CSIPPRGKSAHPVLESSVSRHRRTAPCACSSPSCHFGVRGPEGGTRWHRDPPKRQRRVL
ncbi:MAG: hypothetical protein R6U40_00890, partial [Desulfobacterales bacterium]